MLALLEEQGNIKGLPGAWNTAVELIEVDAFDGWREHAATTLFLAIASTEFVLITTGISGSVTVDENGHWHAFAVHMESVEKGRNKAIR